MTQKAIYAPLISHFELKLEIFGLQVKSITLSRLKKPKRNEQKTIAKEIKTAEESMREVEEIIDEFGKQNPFKNELRFNIIKLKQIEGLTHTAVSNQLDCSLSYIALVIKEYKEFYYQQKGVTYEQITT